MRNQQKKIVIFLFKEKEEKNQPKIRPPDRHCCSNNVQCPHLHSSIETTGVTIKNGIRDDKQQDNARQMQFFPNDNSIEINQQVCIVPIDMRSMLINVTFC